MKCYFIYGGGWASNLQYCCIINCSNLRPVYKGTTVGFRLIKKLKS